MITTFQEDINYLEIHYILNVQGDHSLDALVLNRAQYQFILLAKEIANLCGIEVQIESQAISEGGIRDTWKVLGENGTQITALIAALGLLATAYPIYRDRGISDLQRDSLHLDIELKKQEIEKNKKQQLLAMQEAVRAASPKTTQKVAEKIKEQVEFSHKAKIIRSKYFQRLTESHKVKSLEFRGFRNGKKTFETKIIHRENFDWFILKTDELPPDNYKEALIEIIAPVISKGKYKWKGKFRGEPIDFRMLARSFRHEVLNGKVSFKSGVAIECELDIRRKIDDDGFERITGYNVLQVSKVIEEGVVTNMPQKVVRKKKEGEEQLSLF